MNKKHIGSSLESLFEELGETEEYRKACYEKHVKYLKEEIDRLEAVQGELLDEIYKLKTENDRLKYFENHPFQLIFWHYFGKVFRR